MKAFVTGGTGFIGSNLIDYLLEKDFEIFALVRNPQNLKWLEAKNIHILEGDLFSIPPLPSDIDFVFHIAGIGSAFKPADYYTVNQQGTASLFQALTQQGVSPRKIIFLSSTAAAGPTTADQKVSESTPPHPISPYGESKFRAEGEALKYSKTFPLVILRAAAVYGPRDMDFLRYFRIIKKGILPSLSGPERLVSLCYVKDLCRALFLSTKKELPSGEIINIAYNRPYPYDEIGITAGKILKKKLHKLSIPRPAAFLWSVSSEFSGIISRRPNIFNRHKYREMVQKSWVADTTKAAEKLSFEAEYSLEEGLRKTLPWYENNGLL
ncbi:MAG: NAD-dependent epimerase/dehydratase family protein [Candidatus Aminicenantales bacterium]